MQLVQYLHACCFSPVPSTFKKAIKKGFLKSFPGLTVELVDKYLPTSIATAKDHLVQERQYLQTTKTNKSTSILSPIDDLCEKITDLSVKNHNKALVAQTTTSANDTKHINKVAYVLIKPRTIKCRIF